MAKGGKRDGAGRKAGSLNKDKAGLHELLASKFPEWDPVMAMAEVANDSKADPIMRFQAAKEVAHSVHPKRKAMDITTGGDRIRSIVIELPPDPDGETQR
jgi:hypothetical protein